ncbi:MBL fold metallo-hydrolase [Kocuria sp.]|uniref:MBL fold metallo-hydrolase n=1 Tax=Kocuria sp. TaxID=1871328 RepID=UPI0026DEC4B8|nr:MBL fold metallo-hydrolase [Kocuria sp.]MDO5617476.1 MBL fold metallo-hydrolase [Kocuria sp.]
MITINEVGTDVHVITTENWRLNSGLIVGANRALVIDTGAGPRQGRAILEAVRKVTQLPLVVLNTHAHFDHYMGNAVFQRAGATDFWSHRAAAHAMEKYGDYQRSFVGVLEPEMGEGSGLDTRIVVPSRHLPGTGRRPALTRIDLGERQALVFSLGRGHTDNDVLVGIDDVVFAGDVVEQGADPSFEDSFPQDWVSALEQLADLERYRVVVPGHGLPVDHADVRGMAATMATAIERIMETNAQQTAQHRLGPVTASMFRLPYGAGASRILLDRLMELDVADEAPAPSDGQPTS